VFETESKRIFGAPQGIEMLKRVTGELGQFPVIAIGGVNAENARDCFAAGVTGVAAISLFENSVKLGSVVKLIHDM
jgi:thiamine-phosphate pyrophosphorylase